MTVSNPTITAELLLPIDSTAQSPALAFGSLNSGTGIYGTFGQMSFAINGVSVCTVDSNGITGISDANVLIQPLTGYVSGAGVLAASDTILQGFNKLNGNAAAISTVANAALPSASFTSAAVTAKVLTGLGAGSNVAISATDTILAAMAKLQAQITALGGPS